MRGCISVVAFLQTKKLRQRVVTSVSSPVFHSWIFFSYRKLWNEPPKPKKLEQLTPCQTLFKTLYVISHDNVWHVDKSNG